MSSEFSTRIVGGWFEDDNWEELGVGKSSFLKNARVLIPWGDVIDCRFFPQFDRDESLDRVHIIAVTQNIIHHVFLGRVQAIFSEYPVANVSIKLEFKYRNGAEDSMIMYFDVGELRADGKPWIHYLIAPAKVRKHAVSLVSLMNRLKEDSISYED